MKIRITQTYKSRFIRIFVSHGYGQAITIAGSVLTPPLLLMAIGPAGYGHWILISAISTLAAYSDVGLVAAAGNEILMKNTDISPDADIFKSLIYLTWKRIAIAALPVIVASVIYAHQSLNEDENNKALFALVILIFSALLTPLVNTAVPYYRQKGRQATGIVITNTIRAAEIIITTAFAYITRDLVITALATLIIKLPAVAWVHYIVFIQRANNNGIMRDLISTKRILENAASSGKGHFMSSIGINASLQLPVLLLGTIGNSAQIVLYSASRTISRISAQLAMIAFDSRGPDLTDLYAKGDVKTYKRLAVKHASLAASISLVSIFPIACGITWLERYWLRGEVILSIGLLITLVLATAAHLFTQGIQTALNYTNNSTKSSKFLLAFSIIIMPIAFYVLEVDGAIGIAIISLCIELISAVTAIIILKKLK